MNEQRLQEIQKALYSQGENSMAIEVREMWNQIKEANKVAWFYGTQCKWSLFETQFTYEHSGPFPDYMGGAPARDYLSKFKVDYESYGPMINQYKTAR